jgi:hypothetical protein
MQGAISPKKNFKELGGPFNNFIGFRIVSLSQMTVNPVFDDNDGCGFVNGSFVHTTPK